MHIGWSTHRIFSLVFTDPLNFADILVGVTGTFYGRGQGKWVGSLVKLRRRELRIPLPSIHLANVRSLANKMDKLLLLQSRNFDFSRSAALCFTETWLSEHVPNNALRLVGFQLLRTDGSVELSGKTKGGGICFYVNESWYSDVTVLSKACSPLL